MKNQAAPVHPLRRTSRSAKGAEKGQVLVLFAAGLVIFLGLVALSVDVGRYVWARTQMQSAVDAAALAAAQSLPSTLLAEQYANTYWNDNSGFIQSQGTNIQFSFTVQPGSKSVRTEAEADVPTWFARFFGVDSWHVSAEGEAESVSVDAMLVLDRSGSMCWDSHGPNGSYVSQVRLSGWIDSSQTSFQVTKNNSSVPLGEYVYVGQVFRLESSNSSEWLEITALTEPNTVSVQRNVPRPSNGNKYGASSHNSGRRIRGSNCVEAGAGPYYPWEFVKDGGHTFVNQMDSQWDRVGYVQFASRASEESPLTGSFTTLHSDITSTDDPTQGAYGSSTNISHGFYLGIRELIDNGRDNAIWVVVLLSDGVANRYCSPTTFTPTCTSNYSNTSTAYSRTIEQASYAASHNITVYTISYGDNADDDLMEEVADITGGIFYKAPSAAELQAAFISIAAETHIRLLK